eukprot:scpid65213/ scgid5048/ Probable nitrite transporter At1g68570
MLHVELRLGHVEVTEGAIHTLRIVSALGSFVAGVVADRWFGSLRVVQFGIICRLVSAFLMMCASFTVRSGAVRAGDAPAWVEAFVCIALLFGCVGRAAGNGVLLVLGVEQYRKKGRGPMEASAFFPLFLWWYAAASIISTFTLTVAVDSVSYSMMLSLCTVLYAWEYLILMFFRERLAVDRPVPVQLRSFARAIRLKLPCRATARMQRDASRTKPPFNEHVPLVDSFDQCTRTKYSINAGPAMEADVADAMTEGARLFNILPILIACCVPAGFIDLLLSAFVDQGQRMKQLTASLDCNTTGTPPGTLTYVTPVMLLIAIPFLHKVVYRMWQTLGGICCRWTLLRRIGLGMLIAIACSLVAVLVEIRRQSYPVDGWSMCVTQHHKFVLHVSGLSMAWQLPQYLLYSLSFCLVYLSVMEFTFTQSSNRLRNTYMGALIALIGLGRGIARVMLSQTSSMTGRWGDYGQKFNRLQLYFTTFASLASVSFFVFFILACKFKPKLQSARATLV